MTPARYRSMTREALIAEIDALEYRHQIAERESQRSLVLLNAELAAAERRWREAQAAQAEIEGERDRYARLFDGAPFGHVRLDRLGRVAAGNRAAAALLGVDPERVAGTPLVRLVAPFSKNAYFAHLHAVREGRAAACTVAISDACGGVRRWVALSSVPAADEERESSLCDTSILDITAGPGQAFQSPVERRRAEFLLEHSPAVLWTVTRNGTVLHFSRGAEALLGYTQDEAHAMGPGFWMNNVHPEDRPQIERAYARVFRPDARHQVPSQLEYRRRNKSGEWVWVHDQLKTAVDESGVPVALGLLWDISERKKMELSLRESEERFRQIAENIREVFYLSDVETDHIFYASPAFAAVWGFPAETLYTDPHAWQRAIHRDDRRAMRHALAARRQGRRYEASFRIVRPDGSLRHIRARGFPIHDAAGRAYRVAGIAEDITETRKAAEVLRNSHRQMRELASHLQSMAEAERKRLAREIHDELGALLLSVKMDVDHCRKRQAAVAPDTAPIMDALIGRIDASIDSVRRIATALRPSILDNVGVLAAVEWQAEDVQRRSGIRCSVDADTDGTELALSPEHAIAVFRIVQEALTNAVRHSRASRVKVALRQCSQGVELEIQDNGSGFDPAHVANGNWGLVGMAERAHVLGGRFEVASAPGRGTTVTAVIPTDQPRRGAAHTAPRRFDIHAQG